MNQPILSKNERQSKCLLQDHCRAKRVGQTGVLLCLFTMTMAHSLTISSGLNPGDNQTYRGTVSSRENSAITQHDCTIERITNVEFQKIYGNNGLPPLFPKPIIVRYVDGRNQKFVNQTTPESLLGFFGSDFNVKLTSSNALSERSREVPLSQYLHEILLEGETPVARSANESWYLFGNTHTQRWNELLEFYDTPSICAVCDRPDLLAHSFGIGNRGSGVQWHVHGPGVTETLHGRKHWMLYPKDHGEIEGYHKDQSSWQWFNRYYPSVAVKPLECIISPGEVLYFPDGWWHATINWDRYTAFVSTFASEHKVADLSRPSSFFRNIGQDEL